MNQLIQQMPIWLCITISIVFVGILGYVFGIKREKPLPDESEVIGKDLPVGSLFLKDGEVVKVVNAEHGCKGCIYKYPKCAIKGKGMVCCSFERKRGDTVIFKYVDHE